LHKECDEHRNGERGHADACIGHLVNEQKGREQACFLAPGIAGGEERDESERCQVRVFNRMVVCQHETWAWSAPVNALHGEWAAMDERVCHQTEEHQSDEDGGECVGEIKPVLADIVESADEKHCATDKRNHLERLTGAEPR